MARASPHRRGAPARGASPRIIGGQWRGRPLPVAAAAELRPTPARVRETLFNWLAPSIAGAHCVDAFAGTGALGLEALSRGAAYVDFWDTGAAATAGLRAAIAQFDAGSRARVARTDARHARLPAQRVDIVFIDPPFAADLHGAALAHIAPVLARSARVYLEYPAARFAAVAALLGDAYTLLRAKRAGRVGYCLARAAPAGEHSRL